MAPSRPSRWTNGESTTRSLWRFYKAQKRAMLRLADALFVCADPRSRRRNVWRPSLGFMRDLLRASCTQEMVGASESAIRPVKGRCADAPYRLSLVVPSGCEQVMRAECSHHGRGGASSAGAVAAGLRPLGERAGGRAPHPLVGQPSTLGPSAGVVARRLGGAKTHLKIAHAAASHDVVHDDHRFAS